jgi:RNA polymerase sigma-70 factor (ECF subfamily)
MPATFVVDEPSSLGERVDEEKDRFTAMYDAHRKRVWAYAAGRVGAQAADEVVSETFMVAWRRFSQMPSAPLPWLLGVARNVIRESVRAQMRQESLTTELRTWGGGPESDVADGIVNRMAMLRALAELSDADREVLTLLAWQGLRPREAAQVIGCTTATLRVRLHRARRRLTRALGTSPSECAGRPVETIEMEWT